MTINEILGTTNHRPWEMQAGKWKYYQEWNNALFLHWQVKVDDLTCYVPEELEIDLYQGKPWVSLVAFTMENIRPRNLPPFPPVSDFHEINIRTYVKKDNKAGVYFLSIEGGTSASCTVAKILSELPYRYSKMKRTHSIFFSKNTQLKDKLYLKYNVGEKFKEKSDLDRWLTERYALFQDTATSITEFEIHHLEWPISELEIIEMELGYPRFAKFFTCQPDKVHYSPGVQVLAWDKKKAKRRIPF